MSTQQYIFSIWNLSYIRILRWHVHGHIEWGWWLRTLCAYVDDRQQDVHAARLILIYCRCSGNHEITVCCRRVICRAFISASTTHTHYTPLPTANRKFKRKTPCAQLRACARPHSIIKSIHEGANAHSSIARHVHTKTNMMLAHCAVTSDSSIKQSLPTDSKRSCKKKHTQKNKWLTFTKWPADFASQSLILGRHQTRVSPHTPHNEAQLQPTAADLSQKEAWDKTGWNSGSSHFTIIVNGQQMFAVQIGQLQTRLVFA